MTNTVAKHMIDTQGLVEALHKYLDPIASYTATEEEKKNFLNYGIHTSAQLLNILDERLDQLSETVLDMESENERLSKMEANIANTISVLEYLQKTAAEPSDDDEVED
nr:MAG TPA: hypothetical protein [Caudoviricetes sp.]